MNEQNGLDDEGFLFIGLVIGFLAFVLWAGWSLRDVM